MNGNTTTLNALDRGLEVDPTLKDNAITSRVMKSVRIEDSPNAAFPVPSYAAEDDSPSSFVRNLRAGRDMRLHI
jgi:hypothetical protein